MAKNWAISIGINHYDNLQSLKYARSDAEVMKDWFEGSAKFDKVFLFTEDSPDIPTNPPISTKPTYGRLRRFFRVNFEKPLLSAGDNLWFFFAGHGKRYGDRDYLMLSDSDPGDVESSALSVSWITERLRRWGADNVVMFLDACRDIGTRDGIGIGTEKQPGVITFYGCSPNQQSYEIEQLSHGSFTYSLLECLQLRGEENCATVERLYQGLRYRVSQINRKYEKPLQVPYAVVEPATKLHLILLPDRATLNDIAQLKLDAYQAEVIEDWELARQLWIRVNVAARGSDMQAIEAFSRIAQKSINPSPVIPIPELATSSRGEGMIIAEPSNKQEEETPIPLDSQPSKRIFISYKRDVEPDEEVALQIKQALSPQHQVFIDQKILVGTDWAELIEAEIREADFLIVLLSEHSVRSEMVETEIRMAHNFAQMEAERPVILPVRLSYRQPFGYPLSAYLNHINWAFWENEKDTPRLIEELNLAIREGKLTITGVETKDNLIQAREPSTIPQPFSSAQPLQLEMPSGTIETESPFYIERPCDAKALQTIAQQGKGVTIVIKGARQVGKSSLLIRTMNAALKAGKQFAYLDFQLFDRAALSDADLFFRRFCCWLTDVLEMEDRVEKYWNPALGNNQCCTRYMSRYILKELGKPLVLAMDEVERAFDSYFRSDFFGMLRSWHNSRATMSIWKQLDLALVTSTEPYELIPDLTQSPFNVGQVIELEDFTPEQVRVLNQRHGSPLNPSEESQLMTLLGGHPYLVRRALYLVASQQISSFDLFNHAIAERGPFGDHLRHHLSLLHEKQELIQGLLEIIIKNTCKDKLVFWRLRGAGLVRRSGNAFLARCQLYADYFRNNLHV